MNENVVATIIHNEYKDVLFNNKCIRHSMIRIRSKDHRIGTYEIKKTSLSRFDDKIYIQNNWYDGSAELIRKSDIYLKTFFCQAYFFSFHSNRDNFL